MEEREVLKEFAELKGIGGSKAKLLWKAGFHSLDDLREASEESIAKLKGIGPNLAKKIKGQLLEAPPKYLLKVKPQLTKTDKRKIKLAREIRRRKPAFRRQESFRYKRLEEKWRRPRGHHSKLRLHKRYRPPHPSIGYRSPKETRGLHPSGFKEVLINNPDQLTSINPSKEAIRISGKIGGKKRALIEAEATKQRIQILNRRKS
jgi:large subunit ribosomal protein L32e